MRNNACQAQQEQYMSRANERISTLCGHLAPHPTAARARVITEPPRELEVIDECDVLVVGSGPAGLSAALGAARAGADVMLLERFGCFGGVITTVGMETLGWYRYEGTSNDSEGIGREMERVATRMGGSVKWPYNDSQCLDADAFKVVADRLVEDAGVRPLLHCLVVDVIMDEDSIQGVVIESKSGRQAVLGRRVIDCTGDADVLKLAGGRYETLPTKERMAVTTVFGASGVDKKRFLEYTDEHPATYKDWSRTWEQETTGKEDALRSPYLDTQFEEARKAGVIPDNDNTRNLGGSWSALTDEGEATNLNLAHLSGFDCTDVRDLTRAEIEGRKQGMHALQAMRHTVPGFEHSKLRTFSMTLGTRDSRKAVGKYNLTGDDCRNQARFDDVIGIFPEFLDGYNILILPTSGRYFHVPFGCICPEKIDNLLVAGRCVAGDSVSHTAMRNMMACTVTGQGAGVAAAVSVREGTSTGSVDIRKVQDELRRQGVRLD